MGNGRYRDTSKLECIGTGLWAASDWTIVGRLEGNDSLANKGEHLILWAKNLINVGYFVQLGIWVSSYSHKHAFVWVKKWDKDSTRSNGFHVFYFFCEGTLIYGTWNAYEWSINRKKIRFKKIRYWFIFKQIYIWVFINSVFMVKE